MHLARAQQAVAPLLAAVLAIAIGCAKPASDSQLTGEIQSKFAEDSGLQAKSLAVQTSAGVATISGYVDNDAQRQAAARYASSTPGIKQVINNVQVGTPSAQSTSPAPPETASISQPQSQPAPKPRPGLAQQPAHRPTQHAAQNLDANNDDRPSASHRDPSEWDTPSSESSNPANNTTETADANSTPPPPAEPATPPPPPAPKLLTLQSGTNLSIRLVDSIDSETAQQGQTFHATLDSGLTVNGEVAVAAGYSIQGHVVEIKSAGKFAGQSLLVLQLDKLSAGGKSYILQTEQFKRQGSNRSTNTAEKVGGGAAIGAILGGILGGGKGAGIGAAAGGGIGGGVQAAGGKGQQIKLASESVLTFSLQSPLTVTQVEKAPDSGRPRLDTPQ